MWLRELIGRGALTVLAFMAPAIGVANESKSRVEAVLDRRDRDRIELEDLRFRFTLFDQRGRGYQSQAGPLRGPGSERLLVYQPTGSFRIRGRDDRIAHNVALTFDVVTAASPDALDAVSSASRTNEAGTLDVTTTFESNDRSRWSANYGVHIEEHWRTGFGGLGYAAGLLNNQVWVSSAINFVGDSFDGVDPNGDNSGPQQQRYALNHNVSITSIVSRTTVASLSYGFTAQWGTLFNTWNSVYVESSEPCVTDSSCGTRIGERFPGERFRHALGGQLNQHIARTRSTFKFGYRYYRDNFGLQAHTGSLYAYQYLVPDRLYLRAFYRLHWQTGVDFYTTAIADEDSAIPLRTADSDLGSYWAHHAGGKLVFNIVAPNSTTAVPQNIAVDYSRYQRTTGLSINMFSIGYARGF